MVNAFCSKPVVLAFTQILRCKMVNSRVDRALGKREYPNGHIDTVLFSVTKYVHRFTRFA